MLARLVLVVPLAAIAWLSAPDRELPGVPAPQHGADPDSAQSCGECHVDFYNEWKGRAHANAWTDEVYQAALKDKTRPETCHNCHIPEPVLDRVGRKPKTRDVRHEEGVTCVSCHRSGDAIAGPFGATTDAHPVRKDPHFLAPGSNELCASCHATKIGPVLPLARDFEDAKMAEKGESCVGCHMPEIVRPLAIDPKTKQPGEVRKTRAHTILGPNDVEFAAQAFAVAGRRDGEAFVITIKNEAGHRIPGLTIRSFPYEAVVRDAEGKELGRSGGAFSSDAELMALQARELRVALPEGAKVVEFEIRHRFEERDVAKILTEQFSL